MTMTVRDALAIGGALVAAGGALVAAGGCGSSRPQGRETAGNAGGGPCVARALAHENTEAVNVAVSDDAVVWQDYNFGAMRIHSAFGDGETRTLVEPFPESHMTADLLVYAGYAYWSSKLARAVFRVPLAGGPRETLIETSGEAPTQLARVGDTIYAATFDKVVYWWSPAGGAKSIVTTQAQPTLAGRDDQLYLGREYDVAATLDLAHVPPHQVAATDGRASSIAITGSMLYWLEPDDVGVASLMRQGRSGGEASKVEVPGKQLASLVATDGGVYLTAFDSVVWVDDRATAGVVVGRVADEPISDLAVLGDAVFVGTVAGNVHQLCAPSVSGTQP